MRLTHKVLQVAINPTYLQRGRDYYRRGMVIKTESQHDGHLIIASVRGSGRKTYKAQIHIDTAQGQIKDIHGHCSCPVHYNCKHVAAALLHHIDHQTPQQDDLFGQSAGDWLQQLKTAQQDTATKKQSAELILYILGMNRYTTGNQLYVNTVKTRQLKNGCYAPTRHYSANANSQAKFMRDDDPHALTVLQSLKANTAKSTPPLVGASGAMALQILIDTGRCHWLSESNPALKHADTVHSALSWHQLPDTSQVIHAEALDEDYVLLPVIPPHYINTSTGECGELDCDLPEKLASVLVASPAVKPEDVSKLIKVFNESFKGLAIPIPSEPDIRELNNLKPVPCLRLLNDETDFTAYEDGDKDFGIAELQFEYHGLRIHPSDDQKHFTRQADDHVEIIYRNEKEEASILKHLDDIGLIADDFFVEGDALRLEPAHISMTWFDFMLHHRSQLEADGWQIEIDDDFAFQFDQAEDWYANITETSHDWFTLELGVNIDGHAINLLPFLVSYLSTLNSKQAIAELNAQADDYPLLLQQKNGHYLHIPLIKVRHIIATLVELYEPNALDKEGKLELSRYQSNQLSALDNIHTQLTWQGGQTLRKFGDKLQNFDGIRQIKPPTTLKAELREYQSEGLNWLQFLREYELGGILADDMGLGKTIQTLAHLLVEKRAHRTDRPNLVIAPTSLMVNWKREAQRFAPSLNLLVLHGADRKKKFNQIGSSDLVLTTYPLLSRDTDILMQHEWHIVILDEAQYIKNPRSRAAQTARQLKTRHRLCLTGTPMENHLGELWSQFHFLMPGALGDEKRFKKLFRTPIEKHQDATRQQQLRKRLAPFMLRRDKSEVATELPPKTEILSEVELDGAQRELYETIRVSMHRKVQQAIDDKGIKRSQIIILDALLKLRQVCCHPQLLKLPSAKKVKHSAKLAQLMEMLPEMVEEGRRILLFSQFTSMLAIIEDELKSHKIGYVKLTGQTRNREKPIDDFQAEKVPVFLISLKAGGAGLNLTAADTVIHYDPWWNPAAERQATDRAHRIGQDKPVFVYKMITDGTVEEKIIEMQAKKQALADALFSEGSQGAGISNKDLQTLFEPLPN
jgi:superfamily II DNA or RNA helicase